MSVIPIDGNANGKIDKEEDFYGTLDLLMGAIRDGRYPSPSARDLYFVSRSKSTNPVAIEFMKWVLKDVRNMLMNQGMFNCLRKK